MSLSPAKVSCAVYTTNFIQQHRQNLFVSFKAKYLMLLLIFEKEVLRLVNMSQSYSVAITNASFSFQEVSPTLLS